MMSEIKGTEFEVSLMREMFDYDPETGYITRKVSYGRAVAGQEFRDGNKISVLGVSIRYNRLAWALHNGVWPPNDMWIDHINTIKADNRIANLRLATPTQNQQNKSGYGVYPKGVTWRNRLVRPWQAKIRVNGVRIHLGSFEDMEDAAEAYRKAAEEYHGEFARHD
jgi:hypothetical protein